MGHKKKDIPESLSTKEFIDLLFWFNNEGLNGPRRKIEKVEIRKWSDFGYCPEVDDFVGAFVHFTTGHVKFFYFTYWGSDTIPSFRVYSSAYDDPKRVESVLNNWYKAQLNDDNT
jgi:hypothetical protein